MSFLANPKLAEIAERTPSTRDRYVDFLRTFAITVVVLGHWISAVVIFSDTGIRTYNAVGAISGMWAATWLLQVMPLFFFVGGFSNFVSLNSFIRRGKKISLFMRIRANRLLKPTFVFIGIWFVALLFLKLVLRIGPEFNSGVIMVLGPLWFLAVYLMVILISPIMRRLHLRYKFWILVVLLILIVFVDVFHFALKGPSAIRWLNVFFVWFFVHQLGFFYADGTLTKLPNWSYIAMALGGLVGLVVLTNIGVYPRSMVGTGLEKISNMNPPTICIVVLTIWLVGAAMFLRDPVNRWLTGMRPWMMIILANSMIMTMYLWHLTAFAITLLILNLIGLGQPAPGSAAWWLQRPIWIIIPSIILLGFMKLFGRFESPLRKRH